MESYESVIAKHLKMMQIALFRNLLFRQYLYSEISNILYIIIFFLSKWGVINKSNNNVNQIY